MITTASTINTRACIIILPKMRIRMIWRARKMIKKKWNKNIILITKKNKNTIKINMKMRMSTRRNTILVLISLTILISPRNDIRRIPTNTTDIPMLSISIMKTKSNRNTLLTVTIVNITKLSQCKKKMIITSIADRVTRIIKTKTRQMMVEMVRMIKIKHRRNIPNIKTKNITTVIKQNTINMKALKTITKKPKTHTRTTSSLRSLPNPLDLEDRKKLTAHLQLRPRPQNISARSSNQLQPNQRQR